MSDPPHARVRVLFLRATALDLAQRGAYLDRVCAGEPALRRELAKLLAHHEPSPAGDGGRLERLERALAPAPREALPDIAGYRVLGKIAEGGMGTVYDAEQLSPVRRRVAVKLLKRGLDTGEILSRFALERQVLALTQHPGIARIFDAGESRDGRPFFAMERVDGEPITDFCDARLFDVHARLRLFLGVCAAVQHAHQKGILHRDLKPTNILVESFEGRPAVKVIDFGIAKAMWPGIGEGRTERGQFLGTPAYMSPEQATVDGPDVDTRSDVYSLGVVLFELLAGSLPFAGRPGLDAPAAANVPPRPSARVGPDGEGHARAQARGADPRGLARVLRRDLDWIVLKALDPERDRRYAAASELGADVERFLDHEAVLARPPSTAYRLRTFARRHRLAVAVTVTFILAAVLGLAGTSVGLVQARTAEAAARQQARTAEEVSDFLVEIFQAADPYSSGDELTARDLLARGRQRIEGSFENDPAVRGALMRALGRVHTRLARYEDARLLLEEAHRLHRETLGVDHPRTAATALDLAWLYNEQGHFADAEPLLTAAIATLEAAPESRIADLAQAQQVLGVIQRNRGDLDASRANLERSLALRVEYLGARHKDVGFSLYHLGWLEREAGHFTKAEALYRRALAIWELAVGENSALVGWCHSDLGMVLADQERLSEAQDHCERALAIQEVAFGPQHPALVGPLQGLAHLLGKRQRHDEALALLRRALDIRLRALGPVHADIASTLGHVAYQLRTMKRFDEAESHFQRALDMARVTAGPTSQLYANTLNNLAGLYRFRGQLDLARPLIVEVLGIQEQTLGTDHPGLAFTLTNLAMTDFATFRFADAEASFARAAAIRERALGEGYALAYTLCRLGEIRNIRGDLAAAAADLNRGLDIFARSELDPVGVTHRADCLLMRAHFSAKRGRHEDAGDDLQRAHAVLVAQDALLGDAYLRRRAGVLAELGETADALATMRRAIELGYRTPDLARAHDLAALSGLPAFDLLTKAAAGT